MKSITQQWCNNEPLLLNSSATMTLYDTTLMQHDTLHATASLHYMQQQASIAQQWTTVMQQWSFIAQQWTMVMQWWPAIIQRWCNSEPQLHNSEPRWCNKDLGLTYCVFTGWGIHPERRVATFVSPHSLFGPLPPLLWENTTLQHHHTTHTHSKVHGILILACL